LRLQSSAAESAIRLLRNEKQHTDISVDTNGLPFAVPSPSLRFHHFARLFGPDDEGHEAHVWRLGHALFDEIDLALSASITDDAKARIQSLCRKSALSDWLQQCLAGPIEREANQIAKSDSGKKIFTLLTGYQIEKATDVAVAAADFNLATLLAQIGGDANLRADVEEQLVKWKDQTIDAHINEELRRVYALLAGVVNVLPGSNSKDRVELARDIIIAKNLNWKRAFGLHLWYGTPLEGSVLDAVHSYEEATPRFAHEPIRDDPNPSPTRWQLPGHDRDILYRLIQLNTDPSVPLEDALSPRAFTSSPLDYCLPWHLSILLSRSLNVRDFSDRKDGQSMSLSVNASKTTISFAAQLEQLGLWELAIFVLLHLEQPRECVFHVVLCPSSSWLNLLQFSRSISIRAMLSRNVRVLSAEVENRLVADLKIPKHWIAEAKVRSNLTDAFAVVVDVFRSLGDSRSLSTPAIRCLPALLGSPPTSDGT
jgi:nuclear pore complex protein Nup98-Nup96